MKKKFLSVLFLIVACSNSFAVQFDQSIEDMLQEYNSKKDNKIISNVLVRCAALLNITNSINEAPDNIKIEPGMLFTSSIRLRSDNPGKSEVSEVMEEFRAHSKEYQAWFKKVSEDTSNPFDSPALKEEFLICDESAREFLNI